MSLWKDVASECKKQGVIQPEILVEIIQDIIVERARQDERFGLQRHPDGTSGCLRIDADKARTACDILTSIGAVTWRHILTEEFFEAMSETDPIRLREELLQCVAVCCCWLADISTNKDRPL